MKTNSTTHVKALDVNDAYGQLLTKILVNGVPTHPRGKKTLELLNVSLTAALGASLVVLPVRDLNYRFAVAEWLWILFGRDDLATLARYNSKMIAFSDDGETLAGAYGPRFLPQLQYVVENLVNDRDSRQAVATIWTPSPGYSKDVPCTVSLQFAIRNEQLFVTANMRSSYAWLGLPYDFFVFAQLGRVVAGMLNDRNRFRSDIAVVGLGQLTMNLFSSHLYEEHVATASELVTTDKYREILSPVFNEPLLYPSLIVEVPLVKGKKVETSAAYAPFQDVLLAKNKAEALEVLRAASAY